MTYAIAAALLTLTAAHAQQPAITNAKLQELSAANGLEAAIQSTIAKQPGPAWIGYAVPKIPGEAHYCDLRRTDAPSTPIKLEGPTHIAILFRIELSAIAKTRVYAVDCPLDGGGLPFTWLTNVRPADSVAYLSKRVEPESKRGLLDAIAMHAAPEASTALERFAASNQPVEGRKKALFWLANSRGKQGYTLVSRALREDANDKIREHAIFALTLSKEPQAISDIIRAAKEDKHPHVRGKALFWLAQKAARQAIGPINEALDRDPETEVKKKAVFALTQIPNGDGVPVLIQVARSNVNPAVRKQAMFWLGQSKDARALRYLEEILAR